MTLPHTFIYFKFFILIDRAYWTYQPCEGMSPAPSTTSLLAIITAATMIHNMKPGSVSSQSLLVNG